MAALKPMTTELIALTEKKMDMTLDDIIKMSKKTTAKKDSKKPPRRPIKSQGFQNGNPSRRNTTVGRYMDSRSSVRQGVLAQRRSNFHGNQIQATTNVAKKAAAMPNHGVVVNRNKKRISHAIIQRKAAASAAPGKNNNVLSKQRPQTMDALFSNMKQQRKMVFSAQPQVPRTNNRQNFRRNFASKQQQKRGGSGRAPWARNSAQ